MQVRQREQNTEVNVGKTQTDRIEINLGTDIENNIVKRRKKEVGTRKRKNRQKDREGEIEREREKGDIERDKEVEREREGWS